MMDSASIVITALVITIVLQIILIFLVLGLKKNRENEPLQEKPEVPGQSDFRKQREAENRFTRKPPQEHKPKPAPAQGAHGQNIDQLESSLRDINLRLKNADKDQEKERRRIKETISSSPPRRFDNQKPRERDDRFRRNDRSRQDFQNNRSADASRSGPRDEKFSSRNHFEARERRPSSNFQNPAPAAPAAPVMPIPEVVTPIAEKPAETVFETTMPLLETRENLQHGRKFPVKRRALNLQDNQAVASGGNELKGAEVNQPSVSPEKPIQEQARESNPEVKDTNVPDSSEGGNESYASGPISFGR
jgi:hypothetical protein